MLQEYNHVQRARGLGREGKEEVVEGEWDEGAEEEAAVEGGGLGTPVVKWVKEVGWCGGAEGVAEGLCGRAEGKERDGVAGMGGVAEGTKEVMDVPRGGYPAGLRVAVVHFSGQIERGEWAY